MKVRDPTINASNNIIVRLKIDNKIRMLAKLAKKISELHGIVGKIDLVKPEDGVLVRDISIYIHDREHCKKIINTIKNIQGVEFVNFSDRTLLVHSGGKIGVSNLSQLKLVIISQWPTHLV